MGICVTQFDPKQVERCLVASPGYLPTLLGGSVCSCVVFCKMVFSTYFSWNYQSTESVLPQVSVYNWG